MPTQQYVGIVEILSSRLQRIPLPVTIMLNGDTGRITIAGELIGDGILLRNASGQNTLNLRGDDGSITLGATGVGGQLTLTGATNQVTVRLNGSQGDIELGAKDVGGNLVLKSAVGTPTIHLNGAGGNSQFGGNGFDGAITLKNASGEDTLRLHGGSGDIALGGRGVPGDLALRNAHGMDTILLNGGGGNGRIGGNGFDGALTLRNATGQETMHLHGGSGTIELDGDLVLRNADCAEEFEIAEPELIEPGTVMVLDQAGQLVQSCAAYDRRVVGVISGAGHYRPGIVLDRQPNCRTRLPLALVGKVYCRADAQAAPIAIGDLLTTAPLPGHAMKAEDPLRAFGAVIGKALGSLPHGQGLIPILVALQ